MLELSCDVQIQSLACLNCVTPDSPNYACLAVKKSPVRGSEPAVQFLMVPFYDDEHRIGTWAKDEDGKARTTATALASLASDRGGLM